MKERFDANSYNKANKMDSDELTAIGLYSKRVLVVEDITYVQRIISRSLTSAGYTVITASNGAEAIEKINRYAPALVTIDMNLPDIKGTALLEVIKKKFNHLNIKSVFISAVTNKSEIKAVLAKGADYYLIKPFKKSDLVQYVDSIIGMRDKEMNEPVKINLHR